MVRLNNSARTGLGWLGAFLLALNLYGLTVPLRAPDLSLLQPARIPSVMKPVQLSPERVRCLVEAPCTDRASYLRTANRAIYGGLAHYWRPEGAAQYNLRIPPTENYLLWAAGVVFPKRFYLYEFCDWQRAVERGVGMCSQHALALADVLRRKGIPVRAVVLKGHYVLEAQVDGRTGDCWLADPDLGVVIPCSLAEARRSPQVIRTSYQRAGYSGKSLSRLTAMYCGPAAVRVIDGMRYPRRRLFESLSYWLVWLIPVGLLAPSMVRVSSAHRISLPRVHHATG